ncbi:MAG TPA: prolyl oligopeptidase family serine peptidase [Tepidisphaeraceae bacterium]
MNTRLLVILLSVFSTAAALAQAPDDLSKVKPIPPPGKPLAAADRTELESGVAKLGDQLTALQQELKDKPDLLALLPDVQIYHNAVRYPLVYNEPIDPKAARQALADAGARIKQLRDGKPQWINQTGPRGYVSKIDGSVQPYVLVVPDNYNPADKATKYRFDFWCHGRGEDLMELKFIRSKELAPKDHFAVNLYGRYCNANKFAGEIDLLEALDDVKRRYPVDENRLVDIGFSMGGAAAWQFAVHYTDLFAAASPGAGFSESREFLHIPQSEVDAMAPWERALWHMYDCTDWAANLAMLPTIAYAGELDGQKQASDMMEKAMAGEGLKLERLIGPQTKHAYHKETRKQLDERLAAICAIGRNPAPDHVRFTTWTLRYNRMFWVSVEGLAKHWERARIEASITGPDAVDVKTTNVTALLVDIPATAGRFAPDSPVNVTIDGAKLQAKANAQKGLHALFERKPTGWTSAEPGTAHSELKKRPGLQGPIDDAFMEPFLIVKPTGKALNDKVGKWAAAEADHAILHWHKQFRGEARVKNDTDLTDADVRDYNLILFGDPSSNATLAKIADKLPIRWTGQSITVGEKTFDAAHHVPALIYPNPLNPQRYVVLNSGFTFRELDYLNNARQTPKLADYAVIDIDAPVTARAPGKIVLGGFFDEEWKVPQ